MNNFLFSDEVIKDITRREKEFSCTSCGLYKNCISPKIPPFGNFKKGILNIGEAPGEVEDKLGKPWQGKVGGLLKRTYKELGIDLFDDCLNINAVNCRCVDSQKMNRTPTNFEIDCCRKSVIDTIKKYSPKVIVLFGNAALQSVIGYRWKKDFDNITKWRGWAIPDQDFKTWIIPVFHPSYIERAGGDSVPYNEIRTVWINDLQLVNEYLSNTFLDYKEPVIEIIEDLSVLNNINSKIVAIDFETTGIKPQAKEHKIISCAIADSPDHCYCFFVPDDEEKRKPLLNLLGSEKIRKVAHNIKYEDSWSVVKLGQKIVNWEWDTMIMSHILDNRAGITGLKFQVYVNFGVMDYDGEIEPFLKTSDDKNANSMNNISKLISTLSGKEKLLKYNALDAIFTFRLYEKQNFLINTR